tara:strand:+ start:47 stop:262 length:216 start_codon:yes stop_codon:yes gene_type:complete
MQNFKQYCEQIEACIHEAEKRRDELVSWKQSGMMGFENGGQDCLPELIKDAEDVVHIYKKMLEKVTSLKEL